MASTSSQIPTSFGHELRACFRFHLVKTYDQEDLFPVVTLLQFQRHFQKTCRIYVKKFVCSKYHRIM
ncbi:hypothetical protein V6N13_089739 [Hibiscus sabdariffa]